MLIFYLMTVAILFSIAELIIEPNVWWQHLIIFVIIAWICTIIGAISDPPGDSD